jgi:hypothetical protein
VSCACKVERREGGLRAVFFDTDENGGDAASLEMSVVGGEG